MANPSFLLALANVDMGRGRKGDQPGPVLLIAVK